MKTKFILFIFLLVSGMMSAQVKRVAILETVDKENKVSYASKLMLRTSLSKAITNTAGYEAYDRTDIDAIMGEQNFQRTGLVSTDQIKRLGEMAGVNYILVAEAAVIDTKNMFITAKLLDVETARTIITDYVTMGMDINSIQQGCTELAKKMFYNNAENTSHISSEKNIALQQEQDIEAPNAFTHELIRNSRSTQQMFGVEKYSYGNLQMDEKAFINFLYKNNKKVYADYVNGTKLITAGWWLFGGGLFLAIPVGVGLGIWSDIGFAVAGIPGWTIGGAAFVSSIPVLGVGYTKKNRALDAINHSAKAQNLSLSLQANQNGIGLALHF